MTYFWIEPEIKISYSNLIEIINRRKSIPKNSSSSFRFFIQLLRDIAPNQDILSITDLKKNVFESNNKSKFTIYSSGTTSKPKPIKVSLQKCLRQVKKNKGGNNIWGLCYPENTFASTQVFFQSFFNSDTIVNLFSENLNFREVSNTINKNKITRLTCSPTFLKMLCLNMSKEFNFVKSVTVGGEILDDSTISYFKSKFKNAKLINIYASSEGGSLLYSNSNYFKIPKRYDEKIKIVNNEIVLHDSLVGSNIKNKNEWYQTGDLVDLDVKSNLFKFIGRKNSVINIGGNKVNVQNVEETICKLDYIKDARVFAKENRILGNILIAELLGDEIETVKIKSDLNKILPKYMIPLKFYFTNSLELTKSGKKIRK